MKVFTTKCYSRYYYSRQEEYCQNCDQHFPTREKAEEYANWKECDFSDSDTSYRYDIVEHEMANPVFSTWVKPERKYTTAELLRKSLRNN